jgi:hypothetical protein
MTCDLLFATPVWTTVLDNADSLNQQLLVEGLDYQGDDFFNTAGSGIAELRQRTLDYINQNIKTSAYFQHYQHATVSIVGRQNPIQPQENDTPHWHPDKTLIGAYYVSVPEKSGDILLHDPRGAVERTWSEPSSLPESRGSRTFYRIHPKSGMLLFFPSYLIHSVETNLSDQTRLSIIIDVYAK